jgi:hypothetical protein
MRPPDFAGLFTRTLPHIPIGSRAYFILDPCDAGALD